MKHFLDILYKRKTLTSGYIFIGVAIAFLNAYSASYLQKVLDGFGYRTLSAKVILIYGAILISTCILNYIDEYPNNKLSHGIYLDFKLKAMRKISTIDYSSYQSFGTGSVIQQVENGASSGKSIVFDFYFQLLREHIPSVIFSLIFIATIDKTIMIYIVIGYALVFVVTKVLLKYLYSIKSVILNNEEIFNKYLVRGFMEFVVFRVNNKFAKEIEKAEDAADKIVQSKTKMKMIHEAFFAIFAAFVTIIKVIFIYISWKEDKVSAGALVALLTLIDKAYSPIAIFNVIFVQYKLDKSAFQRLTNILSMPDDINLDSGKVILSTDGNVCFKNISFYYNSKSIFNNLDLRIEAGSAVALVGESGSGKSTLIKLLLGLVKPKEGKIFIDSYDLSEIRLCKYYDLISYTSQDSPIFSGTLRENIVFDKEVSDSEIIKAMYQTGLKDFYESLPMGLDTEVGEKGIMLSGGERQRVALARVYFSEAKIVILDEATSALDNITEQVVMKGLKDFLKYKTIITIAHRLGSIKDYDVIYAFKGGDIVGSGSFDQLICENKYFKQLWNSEKHINCSL